MAQLKTIVKNLSKPLPIEQIDFRVQQAKANARGAFAILLGYKDARVDMARLDEATDGMWQNRYTRDSKGALICEIGIKADDTDDFIWKADVGTESFSDSTKGEYSDAFKRACFRWGIGRELYDLPFIVVQLNEDEYSDYGGGVKPNFKFKPNDWEWERTTEGKLKATDKAGAVRFQEK